MEEDGELMGLGPAVCGKCMMHAFYEPNVNKLKQGKWYCPLCGNTRLDHLFNFSEVQWSIFDDNTRFYKFAAGVESEVKTKSSNSTPT